MTHIFYHILYIVWKSAFLCEQSQKRWCNAGSMMFSELGLNWSFNKPAVKLETFKTDYNQKIFIFLPDRKNFLLCNNFIAIKTLRSVQFRRIDLCKILILWSQSPGELVLLTPSSYKEMHFEGLVNIFLSKWLIAKVNNRKWST